MKWSSDYYTHWCVFSWGMKCILVSSLWLIVLFSVFVGIFFVAWNCSIGIPFIPDDLFLQSTSGAVFTSVSKTTGIHPRIFLQRTLSSLHLFSIIVWYIVSTFSVYCFSWSYSLPDDLSTSLIWLKFLFDFFNFIEGWRTLLAPSFAILFYLFALIYFNSSLQDSC